MANETPRAVAYVPFKTFITSLDTLRQGVPDPIDRSVFRSQSGSTQGMLLGTYKALGLINEGQHPEPILHRLVDPDQRKAAMREVFDKNYAEVMALGPAATQKQFDDLLGAYGITGDTKKKAKSFFVQAAEMAGVKISPYIAPRGSGNGESGSSGTPRPTRTRRRTGGAGKPPPNPDELTRDPAQALRPGMVEKLLDKFPKFDPTWPDEIKTKWFEGFSKLHDDFKK